MASRVKMAVKEKKDEAAPEKGFRTRQTRLCRCWTCPMPPSVR